MNKQLEELAQEIVLNLVDCDSADPDAIKQYVAWTKKKLHTAMAKKDQRIAEAEIRGVEKLAAAFKSWAGDGSFPDREAQRHWATASQEALSFADDLRNGEL
ncbi:hypothetical protein CLM71_08565 [Serratia sp. MYb239]|uniref:hypothetical protein n=1 Tax=Serratia sp. MYb239 TaxID=2033438 RepID=UPI000CF73175|nr:hypothetical protein [Serratia sp. MYb239]AVJ17180.1 hypothetical protein CLM71_08565 [Serratia sp. MYb239]